MGDTYVSDLSRWVDIIQTHLALWIADFQSVIINKIQPWHVLATSEEDSFIL